MYNAVLLCNIFFRFVVIEDLQQATIPRHFDEFPLPGHQKLLAVMVHRYQYLEQQPTIPKEKNIINSKLTII